LLLCAILPPHSAAQTSPQTPDDLLANDPRLRRAVTLDEAGIQLDELLQRLGDDGLSLTCDRACAEQKLQIRLKGRPLRTLMEALAQLLPGSWQPLENAGGYRLEMEAKAVARRERWWKLVLGERERARAALRAAVLQALWDGPPRFSPEGTPILPDDPQEEAQRLRPYAFFRSLPAPLQNRIAESLLDHHSYGPGSVIGGDVDEGTVVVPLRDLPLAAQEMVREGVTSAYKAANGRPDLPWNKALLRFANYGIRVGAALFFPGERAINDGRGIATRLDMSVPAPPEAQVLDLDHRGLVEVVNRLGTAAPSAWRELAAYRRSRVWKNDPGSPGRDSTPPWRVQVLRRLGEQADIEFVADCYSVPCSLMTPAEMERPLTRPLKQELDDCAEQHDLSWKRRADNIYIFRNNRWYRDDRLEVPAPLLRRWTALFLASRQKEGPRLLQPVTPLEKLRQQMDRDAEVVTQLSPWQIANGLRFFLMEEPSDPPGRKGPKRILGPFGFDVDRILRGYHTTRFYAGLPPAQREALLENRLPFGSLSPAQKEGAIYLLPDVKIRLADWESGPILLGVQAKMPLVVIGGTATSRGSALRPYVRLVIASSSSPQ